MCKHGNVFSLPVLTDERLTTLIQRSVKRIKCRASKATRLRRLVSGRLIAESGRQIAIYDTTIRRGRVLINTRRAPSGEHT